MQLLRLEHAWLHRLTLPVLICPRFHCCRCAQANAVSNKLLDLRKCDYSGKNLAGKTLAGALLADTNLSNTNLQEAVLTKVRHRARRRGQCRVWRAGARARARACCPVWVMTSGSARLQGSSGVRW